MFKLKLFKPKTFARNLAGAAGIMLLAGPVSAAVVTAVGADANNSLEWRSTNVAKSLDPDGDNVYGTAGYVLYYTQPASYSGSFMSSNSSPLGHPNTLKSIPSYLELTDNFQDRNVISSSYPELDDPTLSPGIDVTDVSTGYATRQTSGTFMLKFEIKAGAPTAGIRVGIIAPNSGNDDVDALELRGTGNADGTSASYVSPVTGTDDLTFYFFDLTGYAEGDTFQLVLTDNDDGSSNFATYAGVSFDVVPEPASLALLGLGGLLMLGRGRRVNH